MSERRSGSSKRNVTDLRGNLNGDLAHTERGHDATARRDRIRTTVFSLATLLFVGYSLQTVVEPQIAQAQAPISRAGTTSAKAEVVDGVPLVPTTKSQRNECQRFANHLRRQAPCPGLLPVPLPVSDASLSGACLGMVGAMAEMACGPAAMQLNGNLFELSQSNFPVPPGYVGVSFEQKAGTWAPEQSISGGSLGHFVFMAGSNLQSVMTGKHGKGLAPVPPYCSPLDQPNVIRVHGRLANLYTCADESNSLAGGEIILGHTLLVWDDHGMTCEVSFHGHSQVNVDLDEAEANATVMVSPQKR
jgi:hypothetical protein